MFKKRIVTYFFMLTIILSACSYMEFEDSLKNKLNNNEDIDYTNPSSVPNDSSDADKKRLFSVGDTVVYTDVNNQKVEYTLNHTNVADNIKDINLNNNDFSDKSLISSNGAIDNKYRLVTVDVTVKNVNFEGDDLESDNPILFIESAIGFKGRIEDPNGPFTFEASYFSEHPSLDQNEGQDYYQFPLKIDEEIDATVGWFVPKDQLEEEPLYYIIGIAGQAENYQYFEITIN